MKKVISARDKKVYTAIGLMSGTSLDGVDAALVETDGMNIIRPIGFLSESYTSDLRDALRACFGKETLDEAGRAAEREMTLKHAGIVKRMMALYPKHAPEIIGFHGQTVLHDVGRKLTVQIGDAALLARETGVDVVHDFRAADVAAGGQGAPMAPVYHASRIKDAKLKLPVALLNVGGVANITFCAKNDLIAFDTGAGNALMDDYVKANLGMDYDPDGAFAANGAADELMVFRWLAHEYFSKKPPKSLDRNEWDIAAMGPLAMGLVGLSPEDALATLMEFTAQGVLRSFDYLPRAPETLYVCGGGRHNKALMARLDAILPCLVRNVDVLGWNGDATEGECFAYLAVRSLKGLPLSFPGTTGVQEPLTGGLVVASSSSG